MGTGRWICTGRCSGQQSTVQTVPLFRSFQPPGIRLSPVHWGGGGRRAYVPVLCEPLRGRPYAKGCACKRTKPGDPPRCCVDLVRLLRVRKPEAGRGAELCEGKWLASRGSSWSGASAGAGEGPFPPSPPRGRPRGLGAGKAEREARRKRAARFRFPKKASA